MDPSLLHSLGVAFHTYMHDFTDGAGLALHSAHNALFIILNPIAHALSVRRRLHGAGAWHPARHRRHCRHGAASCPSPIASIRRPRSRCCSGSARRPTTADPIAAILFGAPGHAASAATTLDGYPMTRRGEAGRALGASYMAALIGGLFGAALMAVALPIMRPIILYHRLARTARHRRVRHFHGRGLVRQCAAARADLRLLRHDAAHDRHRPAVGHAALDHGHAYLWDGLPLVPLTLGIFALPELCDLAIGRMAIVQAGQTLDTKTGMLLGIKDCMDNWFLILRCSWIGSAMGAIPGIGASVIDWISYGHALQDRKRRGSRRSAPATCAA